MREKLVLVLHAKDPTFRGAVPESLEGFVDVAVFRMTGLSNDIPPLDYAYEHTNTIAAPWYDAPTGGAEPLVWVRGPARSTSVGDVLLVIEAETATGGSMQGYVVAPAGFTEFDASRMVVGKPNAA